MSFAELGLRAELLRAIAAQNYTQPTPIQAQAIPAILSGRDVLAGAQTGTGKTAAFTLPMLELLSQNPAKRPGLPRALVLTPTRELAAQVKADIDLYGANLKFRNAAIFGGVNINPQKDLLRRGVDILVATPGRLLAHVSQRTVDLSSVEILVLDEADRMLDMGFIHDIRKVIARLPAQRQNLLFSATYSKEIRSLAEAILQQPILIEVARRNTAAETVAQEAYRIDKKGKRDLLIHLINQHQWYQVLVFTRTKHGANKLSEQLNRAGLEAAAIHGNKSQAVRTQALAGFKNGKVRVLVATDIASRGLDIDRLPQVVNFELPTVPEDYVHRIGRTGRAGESGAAVSLVSDEELKQLKDIQRLMKRDIPLMPLPAFERRAEPAPEDMPRPPRNTARAKPRGDQRSGPAKRADGGFAKPGNTSHRRPRRRKPAQQARGNR